MSGAFRGCNLCGAGDPSLLFLKNGFSMVQCRHCDLVYVGEEPAAIDFAALYDEAYYTGGSEQVFANYIGEEQSRRAWARRKLWGIRLRHAHGRLLDVGCAAGFFLIEAQRHYEVQGVEFSEFSSSFAREKMGLNVFTGTLQQAALPANHFDIITLWDVIEHVPDPLALLGEAARLLKPGGELLLTTGDIASRHARERGNEWPLFEPPWHLYYFSRQTMRAMAERAGLHYAGCTSRGVWSSHPLLRNRIAIIATNLLGLGDIMQIRFRK